MLLCNCPEHPGAISLGCPVHGPTTQFSNSFGDAAIMTAPASPTPGPRARLRLLATTDLHMHLTAYDYFSDRPTNGGSLSRIATLIHQARAEAREAGAAVLMLDNGDGMQGTPIGDVAANAPDRPHPLMRAFRQIGFDAIGLGNHDFNFGIEALAAALDDAPCPVLGSNLVRLDPELLPKVTPHAILERSLPGHDPEQSLRIGLLSFLPPQTVRWDAHLLEGRIEIEDIVDSAREHVAALRQKNCDLIIALAHSGLDAGQAHPSMENAVIPLAAVPGIDAIIAGHTHQILPGPDHEGLEATDAQAGTVHGKPVLMPGFAGSHLGVADLELERTSSGWTVAGFRTALRPVFRVGPGGSHEQIAPEDPALTAVLASDHAATIAGLSRPAGHSGTPLHSFFSLFAPDRALALLAASQAAALRPLLRGTAAEALPLLSATAPAKCGGRAGPHHYTNVPAGPLCARHIADLCAFPNDLRAVILPGHAIVDWLETSASLFNRIPEGAQKVPLVDPSFPPHDFDVLHGLRYRIDLTQPSRYLCGGEARATGGHRIHSVQWTGRPLNPDQRFVVAVNSYRAAGGGEFAALRGAEQVPLPRIRLSDVLMDYLSGVLPPDPLISLPPAWRFAPVAAASAIALTGPAAEAHLHELDGRDITADGVTPAGFLRLSVPLDQG